MTATRWVGSHDPTLPWYPALHTIDEEKQKKIHKINLYYQGSIHRHVHAAESAHVCVITVYESNMKLILFENIYIWPGRLLSSSTISSGRNYIKDLNDHVVAFTLLL